MTSFDEPSLNIAHRGASAIAPENTSAAFKRAIELGADAVELDVQFSRDQHVVIIHDDTLNRTTNGRGRVNRRTLSELRQLDAGAWFSDAFAGEPLPTLAHVLSFADGRFLLNIEIKKCQYSQRLAEAVVELLASFRADQYLITSFDKIAVEHVKAIQPSLQTGLLFDRFNKRCLDGSWDFIVPHWKLVDEKLCRSAESSAKKIVTWTIDEVARMKKLLAMGIGRIITNYPDRLRKLLSD